MNQSEPNNNEQCIKQITDFIEQHLFDENLNLTSLAAAYSYSKYHLHRMFSAVTGLPLQQYIQRRRLSEAARQLIETKKPLTELALCCGYQNQRSFSRAFKQWYHCSPKAYRNRQEFMPLQLPFTMPAHKKISKVHVLDIKTADADTIYLSGYQSSTRHGFSTIGNCWRKLHKNKDKLIHRTDQEFLFGVNDYSSFEKLDHPVFSYFAGAQTKPKIELPKGMRQCILPSSRYLIFYFRGKCEDSIQPIADYIYHEWFPQSTCILHERNCYDFVKYGEAADAEGISEIQYWVPIL